MSSRYILSAVIPISNMAGKLENLESWYKRLNSQNMETIFIHDKRDEVTGIELNNLVNSHSWRNYQIVEGYFEGPGNARNKGLDLASGQWIAFWDADDIPYPEELLRVLNASTPEIEIYIGNYEVMNVIRGTIDTHKITKIDPMKSLAMNPGIWRAIFRRDKIDQLRFPGLMMGEDQIFLASYLTKTTKCLFVDSVFYRYFVGNPTQLTNNRAVMSDLELASRESLQLCKNSSLENIVFLTIMLERQILTGLRHAGFATKVSLIGIQLKAFLILYPAKSIYIFRALRTIAIDKSKGMHR